MSLSFHILNASFNNVTPGNIDFLTSNKIPIDYVIVRLEMESSVIDRIRHIDTIYTIDSSHNPDGPLICASRKLNVRRQRTIAFFY